MLDVVQIPVRVFISYAHEDHNSKEDLLDHLGGLVNSGQVEAFSDEQILAGEEWDPLIRRKLDEADLIVLLVSAKFLRSRYCTQQELPVAMERHGAAPPPSSRSPPVNVTGPLCRSAGCNAYRRTTDRT